MRVFIAIISEILYAYVHQNIDCLIGICNEILIEGYRNRIEQNL